MFPWCFSCSCCGNPWSFGVFSAYFTGFLRVRKVSKILGVLGVFIGIFEKSKEKKDMGSIPKTSQSRKNRCVLKSQSANQRAPNPPEFAQPRLSRVKRRSSPARGYKFGCVCSYIGRSLPRNPRDRPYRNKHTQICTPSLGTTAICPYSNGAVQIRGAKSQVLGSP